MTVDTSVIIIVSSITKLWCKDLKPTISKAREGSGSITKTHLCNWVLRREGVITDALFVSLHNVLALSTCCTCWIKTGSFNWIFQFWFDVMSLKDKERTVRLKARYLFICILVWVHGASEHRNLPSNSYIHATQQRGMLNWDWTVNYRCSHIPSGSFVGGCVITF